METRIKKVTIKQIYRNETKQDGTAYVNKQGKPFKYVTLIVSGENGQDQKISYCDYNEITADWKTGDKKKVTIEVNGDFTNFKPPSQVDLLEERVKKLEDHVYANAVVAPDSVVPTVSMPTQSPALPNTTPSVGTNIPEGNAKSFQEEVLDTPPHTEADAPPDSDLPF